MSYTDLRVYLVAGDRHDTCATTFAADGATAAGTPVRNTYGLAELPDGSIFFLESDSTSGSSRVRRIKQDGTLETVIGGGATDISACGMSCGATDPTSVKLGDLSNNFSIAARPDGTVFVLDGRAGVGESRVWQLYPPNGNLYPFAGSGAYGSTGDGLVGGGLPTATANSVEIAGAGSSFLSVVGSSVFVPSYGHDDAIRKIGPDGTITRFAGEYLQPTPYADGVFAPATALQPKRLVLGPDGYYYTTADTDSPTTGHANRIVRLRRADDTASGSNILVPSTDGSEVYEFDSTGRHLKTHSRYSGGLVLDLTSSTKCPSGGCYDSQGRLTGLPDTRVPTATASTTTISGYGTGTVTITAPTGQQTALTIDVTSHLTKIVDPKLEETDFTYGVTGQLATLTEPVSANVHHFAYSPTGRLVQDIAPNAGAGSRLTRTDSASSDSVEFDTAESRADEHDVDLSIGSDTFTDANGQSFTRREQRTQTTLASTNKTVDTWYADSSHVHVDPDLTTTSESYAPDPRFGMNMRYVSASTVTTTTSGTSGHDGQTGTKCTSTWNGMCDLAKRTVTGTGFSATSVLDERWGSFNGYGTHATSQWTTSSSDCTPVAAPCIVSTSSEGRKTIYGLDSYDRVVSITPTNVDPITIAYGTGTESIGKMISVSQGTRTYGAHYATSGFVDGVDTPLFASPTHTISLTNDADGNATSEVFTGSIFHYRTVNMHYDANGNRDWLKMPLDPTGSTYEHQFSYTPQNLLSAYTPPDIGSYTTTHYDFDLDGMLSDANPGTGNTVTNVRDGAGRVTNIDYNHPVDGAQIQVSMTYDVATGQACTGAGCSATNGDRTGVGKVTTTDTYDGYLLTSETTSLEKPAANDTIYWKYDNALRRSEQYIGTQGNFTDASFAYDHDSLVSSVSVGGQTYSVTRDPGNGRVTCTCLGSVCESYCYDAYGALTHQRAAVGSCDANCAAGTSPLLDIVYGRDPSTGRITAKNETIGTSTCNSTFGYDPNYPEWLKTGSRSGSTYCNLGTLTQSYDADGNDTAGLSNGVYNHQDQMTSDGYWTYAYDGQGNMLWQHDPYSQYYHFYYDPLSNLRTVTTPSLSTDYDLDFRDRRVGKIKNGAFVEGYLYDGNRVAAHLTSAGIVDAAYVYVTKSNVPDLVLTSSGTYRLLSDQVGTARRLVTSAGVVMNDWDFDAYGVATAWPNSAGAWPAGQQPFGFAGGLWDGDVGLYRFGARDYNPWKGRWWSKDPIGFGGGLNLYAYCDNDPVNCTDPTGLDPQVLPWLFRLALPELTFPLGPLIPVALIPVLFPANAENVNPVPDTPAPAPMCSAPYREPPPAPRQDCGAEATAGMKACEALYKTKYEVLKCRQNVMSAYLECVKSGGIP